MQSSTNLANCCRYQHYLLTPRFVFSLVTGLLCIYTIAVVVYKVSINYRNRCGEITFEKSHVCCGYKTNCEENMHLIEMFESVLGITCE